MSSYSLPPYNYLSFMTIIATLLTYSGTSCMALLIYLVLQSSLSQKVLGFILFLILLYIFSQEGGSTLFLGKISFEYILYLLSYKFAEISSYYYDVSLAAIFLGNLYVNDNLSIASDFGLIGLLKVHGIAGLVLFFAFVLININRVNIHSTIILLATLIHYSAIFSLPGQLIFAYILTRTRYTQQSGLVYK